MSNAPSDPTEKDIDDTLANLQNAKVGLIRVGLIFLFRQRIEVVLLVSFIALMMGAAWLLAYDVLPNTFDKISAGNLDLATKHAEAIKAQSEANSKDLDKVLEHSNSRFAEFKEMLLKQLERLDNERRQPIAVNPLGGS